MTKRGKRDNGRGQLNVRLSEIGWERLERLQRHHGVSKTATIEIMLESQCSALPVYSREDSLARFRETLRRSLETIAEDDLE